ncbi:MAG TPA: nucleotide-binding protein [Polyangiaceae bacterium]|nr:nucleotide-binding protein [Polyangiaceae bacterium]
MAQKPRIYISSPMAKNLTPGQLAAKEELIRRVISAGFDPQEFHTRGLPSGDSWNFERARQLMSRCHGAVILAFEQWKDTRKKPPVVMPTEYTHFEGALAIALDKQLLIIKDESVTPRGIAFLGGGQYILSRPMGSSTTWFDSDEFQRHFGVWSDLISRRHHVFFGYSGKATDTANRIIRYLQSIGVAVRDWQSDFRPAGVILDEIEEAAKTCLGGIFLFSKDDELVSGDAAHAAPRDNVVFEAGFFMHAVGRERTLIIREEGTKMPADIGGGIYLPLQDRNNTSTIETQLRRFIETRL